MYLYVKKYNRCIFYFLRFLLRTLCCNADKYIFCFNSEDIYIFSSWFCFKNNAIFQNFSLAWDCVLTEIWHTFYFLFLWLKRVLLTFLTTACLFHVLYQQIPVNMSKRITALKHCDEAGTVVIAFNRTTDNPVFFFWVNENHLSICYKFIFCYNL